MGYYAVVANGTIPGTSDIYESEEKAVAAVHRAEQDIETGGRYECDPDVLASARIYCYRTRAAARKANIDDTRKEGVISMKFVY